ncbi:MAG: ATP-binding protein [Terriglobales bacterium]
MGALAVEIPLSLDPEYLRVLSETGTLLLADADPGEVCQAVFNKLSDTLGLDAYFHFLVSEDGSELRLQSCRGVPEQDVENLKTLAFGQAVCGTVAAQREPMYVPHVQSRTSDPKADLIRSYGIECYVCFPLMAGGQLLGTFSFGTKRRSTYTPQEIELIHLVCQQITIAVQRRRSQEQLRRMEKLAIAGRLAATVAHEINNPLAGITNLLYLLRDEPLTAEGRHCLEVAEREIERVGQVAKQILQFYRDSAPQTKVPVAEVVNDVARVAGPRMRAKNVEFRASIPDAVRVCAVRGELQQVLTNLVANAIDASAQSGLVEITAHQDSYQVTIRVRDHGSGIPAAVAGSIFEPFFTTKKETGTGLGLWVAKQLVQKNSGSISVESRTEAPSGSTFTLTFPR